MSFFDIGGKKKHTRKVNSVPFSFIAIFDCATVIKYLEIHVGIHVSEFCEKWLEIVLSKQADAIIIRDSGKTETLFDEALAFLVQHRPEHIPIICNHRSQTWIPGTDGVHYKRGRKREFPAEKGYAGVSAHSTEGCFDAAAQNFDYVFISPIFETQSHPGQKGLGLDKLSRICASVEIPVFALGGITEANRHACKVSGAKGTASISLFMPKDA